MSSDNAPMTFSLTDRLLDVKVALTRRSSRSRPQPADERPAVLPRQVCPEEEATRPAPAVDLFPRPGRRVGSRFDDTVALPIDSPQDLDRRITALSLRLRALPEAHELGRRSLQYRAHVERALRQARSARARLDDGSYGLCVTCTEPISLALLCEKPWTPQCVYCALDI